MVTISKHGDYLRSTLERWWAKQIWMTQGCNHVVVIPGREEDAVIDRNGIPVRKMPQSELA